MSVILHFGFPRALIFDDKSLSGVITDPSSPSSFGAWINHVGNHHVGAISFLIVDFFLFFGVIVLTIVQASQVFSLSVDSFGTCKLGVFTMCFGWFF